MKKVFLILTFLFGVVLMPSSIIWAQHQTFLDVEMGGNPELFKYELKQKGFYESDKENYDCLYGKYLEVNCRVWIHEENYTVKKLVINYRIDEWEKLSYEKAKSIADGVVKILIKELQKNNKKYFVIDDTPILGSVRGTIILLENGWYTVHVDGSWSESDWMVFIGVDDEPDNAIYNYMVQQENEQAKRKKNN